MHCNFITKNGAYKPQVGGLVVEGLGLLGLGIGAGIWLNRNELFDLSQPQQQALVQQDEVGGIYYHLSSDIIPKFNDELFIKKQGFEGVNEPVGLYYTNYPAGYTISYMMKHCPVKCILYSFIISSRHMTTTVSANPDKILKLTKSNWRDFSAYIKTHSLKELYSDFAGVDANDKDFIFDYYSYRFSLDGIKEINSYLKTHPNDHYGNIFFPHMFSELRFNYIAPEGCMWRASSWIKLEQYELTPSNIKTLFKDTNVSTIFTKLDDFRDDTSMMELTLATVPMGALLSLDVDTIRNIKSTDIIKYKPQNIIESKSYTLVLLVMYMLQNYSQLQQDMQWIPLSQIKSDFMKTHVNKVDTSQVIESIYMAKYIESGKQKEKIINEPDALTGYFSPTYKDIPEIKFEQNDILFKLKVLHA